MRQIIFEVFLKWSVKLLTFLNLAHWQEEVNLEEVDPRARVMIEAAREMDIDIDRFVIGSFKSDIFRAQKNNKQIIFKHLPLLGSYRWTSQVSLDDKWQAKQALLNCGLPVPYGILSKPYRAIKDSNKISYPLIVKPKRGSLSKQVYQANDKKELKKVLNNYSFNQDIVLEEKHKGNDYRITLVAGKLKAVCLREPANVIGDGKKTVEELIEEKNKKRNKKRSSTLKPIPKPKNINLKKVPEKGKRVYLSHKVNLASGADIIDKTDEVNKNSREMFEKIANIYDAKVIGIDFISTDITRPKKGKIIELNSLPYINMHHEPHKGKSREVAKDLWEEIFNSY